MVYFHNPTFGSNECSIMPTYPFHYFRSCDAGFGFIANMTYHLRQNIWFPNALLHNSEIRFLMIGLCYHITSSE